MKAEISSCTANRPFSKWQQTALLNPVLVFASADEFIDIHLPVFCDTLPGISTSDYVMNFIKTAVVSKLSTVVW